MESHRPPPHWLGCPHNSSQNAGNAAHRDAKRMNAGRNGIMRMRSPRRRTLDLMCAMVISFSANVSR